MCGICGFLSLNMDFKDIRTKSLTIKKMCKSLEHRGPDEEGFYQDEWVSLGHTRLSIIDLDTGKQPIHNEDQSIWIIFNGEIYNYLDLKEDLLRKGHNFYTGSDTEVIVHLYEEYADNFVLHLDGMFAFCLWDKNNRKILIARDRVGKKPLYYAYLNDCFIFSSEIKALLCYPNFKKEIDLQALRKYLVYGYVPSPKSIFTAVNKLPAAHMLSLDCNGKKELKEYWKLDFVPKNKGSEKDIIGELDEILTGSVERRLISDVPLGVFLSGGVDSSLVVAIMSKLLSPGKIDAFTIGFQQNSYNESEYAKIVADHLGVNHHVRILDSADCLKLIPEILSLLDEPMADPSIIPTYLLSKFTRGSVKTALSGDGGDEIFGGYPKYYAHKFASYLDILPQRVRKIIGNLGNNLPLDNTAKRFFYGGQYSAAVRNQLWIAYFTPEELNNILPGMISQSDNDSFFVEADSYCKGTSAVDLIDKMMYLDMKLTLQDLYLTKVDRASMFCSLEVRSPFLDRESVEFGASLPVSLKVKGINTKYILKKVAEKYLPKEIVGRKKQGFGLPISTWLRNELKAFVLGSFARKKIEGQGILNYAGIQQILNEFYRGKKENYIKVWNLLNLQIWVDRWYL